MKLGLLGSDDQVSAVIAAARARGDEVTLAGDGAAGGGGPPGVPTGPWEMLLEAGVCDAVLVGREGWGEARAEAVRRLVQAGRTIMLSQPLELSMLWAFELDMIRRDSRARLVPILPDRLHPFVVRLRGEIEAALGGGGSLGTLETVELERRMMTRDRESVLRQLARDADIVRVLAGEPQRLSTLGGATGDAAWATLAVGFSGATSVPVRWQVARGSPSGLTITVVGANGSQTVEAPDDPDAEWIWSAPTGDERSRFDRGAAMLDVLGGTCAPGAVPAGWDDAARAIELAENVPRSVVRGRAIDLHQEEFSELGTFRGTMASLGCGLVLAGLCVLLLATLVGGVAREAGWEFGERIAGAWPVAVLSVLGLFLALQLLPLVVRETGGKADRTPGEAAAGRKRE